MVFKLLKYRSALHLKTKKCFTLKQFRVCTSAENVLLKKLVIGKYKMHFKMFFLSYKLTLLPTVVRVKLKTN